MYIWKHSSEFILACVMKIKQDFILLSVILDVVSLRKCMHVYSSPRLSGLLLCTT